MAGRGILKPDEILTDWGRLSRPRRDVYGSDTLKGHIISQRSFRFDGAPAGSVLLSLSESDQDHFLRGKRILVISGAGEGMASFINQYTGATRLAALSNSALAFTVDSTSKYWIDRTYDAE